jgi:processive 1,2-diacylglycerol beta-glucosyltransferase
MAETHGSGAALVLVFRTVDRGLAPLATMALDEAGISHVVRPPHISGIIVGQRSDLASAGPADPSAIEILVAAEDEAEARTVLADLARSGDDTAMPTDRGATVDATATGAASAGTPATGAATPAAGAGAVVVDAQSGQPIARLTEDQLAWLGRHLELESSTDTDYYLDRATLEMLDREGGDPALVAALRAALGAREGIDVRWSRG